MAVSMCRGVRVEVMVCGSSGIWVGAVVSLWGDDARVDVVVSRMRSHQWCLLGFFL